MGLLSKLRFGWRPHENLVYRGWYKGDSHFGKSSTVLIQLGNEEHAGTFKVSEGICEIRIGKTQMITSEENVRFNKRTRYINSIPQLGQSGYAGREINYTVKIIDKRKVQFHKLK